MRATRVLAVLTALAAIGVACKDETISGAAVA
jgi:hypothetical protein